MDCPICGTEAIQDEVDIGVGTQLGPPRCDDCGWDIQTDPEYSLGDYFKAEDEPGHIHIFNILDGESKYRCGCGLTLSDHAAESARKAILEIQKIQMGGLSIYE